MRSKSVFADLAKSAVMIASAGTLVVLGTPGLHAAGVAIMGDDAQMEACDQNGVAASFDPAFNGMTVTVDSINPDCAGARIEIDLKDAKGETLPNGHLVGTVSNRAFNATTAGPLDPELVDNLSVVIIDS